MSSALPKLGMGCVASRDAGDFKILGSPCMVSGSAPALGSRRVRLAPDMSKIPPACGHIFFNSSRGGTCWCTRGGRAPRDHGAVALLTRRDERPRSSGSGLMRQSRVDFVAELGTSFDDGLRGLARDGRWLFFIDTTHHHIQI